MTSSDRASGGPPGELGIDELAALARELPREQFEARFPHLFLLLYEDGGEGPVAFETAVQETPKRVVATLGGALRVFAVTKAPGNPYRDRVSIGRARNCDVVLRFPSVSKLHAHVLREGGAWVVIDESSQNGTAIGRAPLAPGKATPLRSGDAVRFGSVEARVSDAADLHDTLHRMLAAARG
jgi:hypothetical protein